MSTELKKIRCSSLPLMAACAPAAESVAYKIESERGPSDLGTAFHACMARYVGRGESPAVTITQEAARNNVTPADLAPLVWGASKVWRETLEPLYPNAEVEREFSASDPDAGIELTGHLDIFSWVPEAREIRVLDYKTGYIDAEAREQLRGYALLGMLNYPAASTASISKWQVREGKLETEVFTREALFAWWEWLVAHVRESNIFRSGDHCERCPRAFACEARTAALRQAAGWLPAMDGDALRELDADRMAEVLTQARALEKLLGRIIGTIKSEVSLRGKSFGPMFIKTEERTSINVGRGYGVLAQAIGVEKLIPMFKVGKGDVEDAVKATAPRGQKSAAVNNLMEQLGEAGALVISTIHKLEVRKNGSSTQLPAATNTDRNEYGETA
jgi:hypothetical protein